MFKLYVRPHLDYGDVVYYIPNSICFLVIVLTNQMEKLESVKYSAALAANGAWKGTSREKLHSELGWESLNLRRWSRRITLFYKILNNLTPDYIKNPVPHPHESNFDLRRSATVGQILVRTQAFKNQVFIPTAYLNGIG